jgi:hypothetical protein
MGYNDVKLKKAVEFAVERRSNPRPRTGVSAASGRPWAGVLTGRLDLNAPPELRRSQPALVLPEFATCAQRGAVRPGQARSKM